MCKSFLTFNTPMAMGTQLGLNGIERVIINLSVPENYGFDTIIHITETKIHISYSKNHNSTLMLNCFYMSPLPTHAHIIAKDASKWHRKYHHSS